MEIKKIFFLIWVVFIFPNTSFSQECIGGSLIYEVYRKVPQAEREKMLPEHFLNGNYPDFLLDFKEISSIQTDALGKERRITLYISPQYLAVGTTKDHFIVPMSPVTAQEIALHFNAALPTPKIVDLIYEASDLKLEPFTYIPRGNRNESPDIFYDHSKVIMAQIKAAGKHTGIFVAGHKKDIVISSKLLDTARPGHVIIYGWHLPDGKPIQPESNIHINSYVDYSHGVRLVSQTIFIDGKEYNYEEVLKDKILFSLLIDSPEPLSQTRY